MENQEIWKAIPGHEGYYEASSLGRIRSLDRHVAHPSVKRQFVKGTVLKQTKFKSGYHYVGLSSQGRHRTRAVAPLIALTFHGAKPDGMECCHNDGVRHNNHSDNLRWDTRINNHADKKEHGTYQSCENHNHAKLTNAQVIEILKSKGSVSTLELGNIYEVSPDTIRCIQNGKYWKPIFEKFHLTEAEK